MGVRAEARDLNGCCIGSWSISQEQWETTEGLVAEQPFPTHPRNAIDPDFSTFLSPFIAHL